MTETTAAPGLATLGSSVTDSAEKVERIREILVGPLLREYTQKLEMSKRELARLQQEVTRLNEQLHEQDKNLRKQMREENERLHAELQEQDQRQTRLLQETEQRQLQQVEEMAQQHTQQAHQLGGQIQRSERTILDELSRLASQLNHAKTDRITLADLLIELGANLKTNDPAPLTKVVDLLDQLQEELQ
jgi:hypothetical protein